MKVFSICLALSISLGLNAQHKGSSIPELITFSFHRNMTAGFTSKTVNEYYESLCKQIENGKLKAYSEETLQSPISSGHIHDYLYKYEKVQIIDPLTPNDPYSLVDTVLPTKHSFKEIKSIQLENEQVGLRVGDNPTLYIPIAHTEIANQDLIKLALSKSKKQNLNSEELQKEIALLVNASFMRYMEVAGKNRKLTYNNAGLDSLLKPEGLKNFMLRPVYPSHPDSAVLYRNITADNLMSIHFASKWIQEGSSNSFTSYSWALATFSLHKALATSDGPMKLLHICGWQAYPKLSNSLNADNKVVLDTLFIYAFNSILKIE